MALPNGHYKRLSQFRSLDSNSTAKMEPSLQKKHANEKDDDKEDTQEVNEAEEKKTASESAKRARTLAKDDIFYIFIGAIGAILAGAVFPAWGVSFTIMCIYKIKVI